MFDVHEQQLLVLLFMVEPENDEIVYGVIVCGNGVDQGEHRFIDVTPICTYVFGGRARDQPAFVTSVPGAFALVVGVEEELEFGVERLVAVKEFQQEERLEEPRDVGPMPFRRADVFHRLDLLVFWGERRCEVLGETSHVGVIGY